jgi:hypothetical protein
MNDMVEKVARALYASSGNAPIWWDHAGDETRYRWRQTARVAIEAMRHPTNAMLMAGYAAPSETGMADNQAELARMAMAGPYGAMIDAAITPSEHVGETK